MFWSAMWLPYNHSEDFPIKKCLLVGKDPEGFANYVGRANYESDLIPGKFVIEMKSCFVPYEGSEVSVAECEVLLDDNYTWVKSSSGEIHSNAVIGGSTIDGENLFIGRVIHNGYFVPGKIHPSHKCIYVPFEGGEHAYKYYEILVKEENHDLLVPVA